MNHLQTVEAIGKIARLFPGADLQAEEMDLLRRRIAKFDLAMFIGVVEDHRLQNDYSRPKLSQIMTEANVRHNTRFGKSAETVSAVSAAEIIKANWRREGQLVDDMSDREVYLRFHAQMARRAAVQRRPEKPKVGLPAQGLDVDEESPVVDLPLERTISSGYANKIVRECTRDLMLAGVDPESSHQFALAIVDPMLSRDLFDALVDDLRNLSARGEVQV